ncbi:DUF262 domain-containing protein [Pedobacter sp. 22226]|uniref:DUF262 domain-containing protein n=1 Tax=Pedobacter sp. 22226 TaxID=3453894 RepID=UPI003F834DFF
MNIGAPEEIKAGTLTESNFWSHQDEEPKDRAEIISIGNLLEMDIRIPEYQRPYKWDEGNVGQLINDIFLHRDKNAYRIGTVVIHLNRMEDKICNDIVDGQQRFITLRLIVYALCQIVGDGSGFEASTHRDINDLRGKLDLMEIRFTSEKSIKQLAGNFQHALRTANKYDDRAIRFFLDKCQVVVFYLEDVTEAFQFFDAQNARGKDLDPHDLLKAFHLREFDPNEVQLKNRTVQQWEGMDQKHISTLFSEYLYRIKGWSNKSRCRGFTKKDIRLFKGVNLSRTRNYPYIRPMMITHKFVDNYNVGFERDIDGAKMDFPFQLDQLIINGRRFFEFVAYYKRIIDEFVANKSRTGQVSEKSTRLLDLVYNNKYKNRDGEKYIRSMFECAMIFYIDKFGYEEIDLFIEKAFVWCFQLRFEYQRLGFDTLDRYVLDHNLFYRIRNAVSPEGVMAFGLAVPVKKEVEKYCEEQIAGKENRRMDYRIAKFFRSKTYYAN